MRLALAALTGALVAMVLPASAQAQTAPTAPAAQAPQTPQTGQTGQGTPQATPKPKPAQGAQGAKQQGSLWEQMVEPNAKEVAAAYDQALILYAQATNLASRSYPSELLHAVLSEARTILAYAHGLNPEHLDVISLLAAVDDELGNIDQALAGYERYAAQAKRLSYTICTRYAYLLARLERLDQAISLLDDCTQTAPISDIRHWEEALILLVCLHSHAGNKSAALDILEHAALPQSILVKFALAVVYDQDGQLSRAYSALEALRASGLLDPAELSVRFLEQAFYPAAESHYYTALLYEVTSHLLEARAAWQAYLLHGKDARFASSARRHIEAIDALMAGTPSRPARTPRR